MKKVLIGAFAFSLFAVAGVASAASITNIEFSNGDTTYQGTGGSTVNAEFRIVVGPGEVVEQFETDVISDGLAPRCESVGGSKGLEEGTHFVKRSIKLPPNTGEYDVDVRTAGIFGGTRSIDCDDNTNGSDSFSDAVRVVGSGNSTSDDEDLGDDGKPSWLDDFLAAIAALIKPTQPTKPAYCAGLGVSMYGQSGAHVVAAQTMLISNGFSIPAGATGYWGVQTQNAWTMAAAKCN